MLILADRHLHNYTTFLALQYKTINPYLILNCQLLSQIPSVPHSCLIRTTAKVPVDGTYAGGRSVQSRIMSSFLKCPPDADPLLGKHKRLPMTTQQDLVRPSRSKSGVKGKSG